MKKISNLDKILITIIGSVIILISGYTWNNKIKLAENKAKDVKRIEEKMLEYREKFITVCDNKYSELYNKVISYPDNMLVVLGESANERCKKDDYFDVDSMWFCAGSSSYFHDRDSFISYCVNWKYDQLKYRQHSIEK